VSPRREAALDGALLLGLLIVVVWITYAYVSYERFFYYWDHALYQNIALRTTAAFRESLPAGWHALQQSFREDYNALFALPLVPWLMLFGASRLSYELILALVYLVPLPLCWGAVATQLLPTRPRVAFWGAVGLALLMPMTWVPVLRGYPDAGAAAMIALATYLYLRDLELQDRMTCVAVGTLLALSVLFRRHFAYAVVAFMAAAGLRALAGAIFGADPPVARVRRLALQVVRLGLVVAVASAVALLVAGDYVQRLIAYDFSALYRSYQEPLAAVVAWYVAPYGWLAWGLAGAGALAGLASRRVHRSRLAFVLLFGALGALQWCWRVRQIGEQYSLHLTPLIVLGWLLLCVVTWDRLSPALARPVLGILVGIGCVNLFLGLTYPDRSRDLQVRPLFAARWAPLVRFDYDEMLRLVRFLRDHTSSDESVYVVGSSSCLNPDIVRQADALVVDSRRGPLNVLATPLVDSDGFYPLGALLEARHVVLARPFQHHLPAQEQEVVKAVYDLFDHGGDMTQDFLATPVAYQLQGCAVTVFERQRPTSVEHALALLRRIRSAVPRRPGMQSDWVVVSALFPSWLTRNADGSARWMAHPAERDEQPTTTLAALGPLPEQTEVSGTIEFTDARCQGVTLWLETLRGDGQVERLVQVRRRPGEDGHFALRLDTREMDPLMLSLSEYTSPRNIEYCLLKLDPLILRPATP
jgi:hypothetical protein